MAPTFFRKREQTTKGDYTSTERAEMLYSARPHDLRGLIEASDYNGVIVQIQYSHSPRLAREGYLVKYVYLPGATLHRKEAEYGHS